VECFSNSPLPKWKVVVDPDFVDIKIRRLASHKLSLIIPLISWFSKRYSRSSALEMSTNPVKLAQTKTNPVDMQPV